MTDTLSIHQSLLMPASKGVKATPMDVDGYVVFNNDSLSNVLDGIKGALTEQQSRGCVEQYCHLRQKPDLSKRMADEMDINLEVFNLETDFFGGLHCSSLFTEMLCDAQAQYGDYSELDEGPRWKMWVKEGGGE